ncbi:lipoprotein [Actinoallomurus vinaceus]|uniref:Lipoprotein n=2 Tax=Actinoallomurus vinaceus TaxID=1080074 RepID=A0ABP8U2D8_9ACTN
MLTGACNNPMGSDKGSASSSRPAVPPSSPAHSSAPANNGVAAKSASRIVSDSLAALRAAKSVHLKGKVRSGTDLVTIDMRTGPVGFKGNMRGPIGGGRTVAFTVLRAGGKVYGKGRQLVQATVGSSAASAVGGKWIPLGSASEASAHGLDFTPAGFAKIIKPSGRLVKGKPTTIAGRPAIGIRDQSGWLYVATTGKPYPLRLAPTKKGTGTLNFTEYDQPFQVAVPTNVFKR